jgi:hypothetical protein
MPNSCLSRSNSEVKSELKYEGEVKYETEIKYEHMAEDMIE